MSVSSCLRAVPGGVELLVFCQPGCARSGVVGLHAGRLKVKVRARPVDQAANRELLGVLAGVLGVPGSRISLTSGEHSRNKLVVVEGADLEGSSILLQAAVTSGSLG